MLNLLPPYLLRLQGDNLVSACLGIILCVIAKMKEKDFFMKNLAVFSSHIVRKIFLGVEIFFVVVIFKVFPLGHWDSLKE